MISAKCSIHRRASVYKPMLIGAAYSVKDDITSKMQPLEQREMRSLIILLFFTAVTGQDYERVLNNGVAHVQTINTNLIIVNLTKNDGTNMVNFFVTKSKSNLESTLVDLGPEKDTLIITRTLKDPDGELLDCFQLDTDDTQWFGGPERRYQRWPVQNMYYEEEPYLPTHPANMALAERYWLSSKGIYIYVSETVPLFLDQNNYRDKYLCMIVKNKAPYQRRENIDVTYTMGVFSDPKIAHQYAVKTHLGKPSAHPNERMIRYPIWSTWARYKADINETVVETFANEIIEHNFTNSQIEIDDKWEQCYGAAVFHYEKFPSASSLVKKLKDMGFRVTLWIHPFINRDCEPYYTTGLDNRFFVKNHEGHVEMSWWQGSDAATIDFTNPQATLWWVNRLKRLQTLDGIDSFKFDAGEVSWLPQVPMLTGSSELQPGIFTQEYTRTLANLDNDSIEVRVGWRSQNLPIFVRMIDKDTSWTWNNGLPTLITTLLQMNLNGYVYVLPDMIGGNGYLNGSLNGTEYPSKEIFIRWLQANVFMPSLQFSFVPWDYDDDTINLCRYYIDLHDKYTPEILSAMQQAIDNGTPVNPPIWWIDPTNSVAHEINDEYLLGESILVAPVIQEGAESRDIYLPKGTWYDETNDKTYIGPMWVKNYRAPLGILPYFKKSD